MRFYLKKIFKYAVIPTLALITIFSLASCNGKDGNDGLSAYEIAVKNGFTGSELEWLESLTGQNGSDGADGANAQSYTIDDVYKTAVSYGYDGSFLDFVKEYIGQDKALELAMNHSLMNSISITATWSYNTYNPFTGAVSEKTTSGSGSGVFYEINKEAGSAYIITNYHVVYNNYQTDNNGISLNLKGYIYGKETEENAIPLTYIGGSLSNDIAVLKIENSDIIKNSMCNAITFSNDENFVGETVYATGNNSGKGLSSNAGNISHLRESASYTVGATTVSIECIRHDVAINGGNSGGGLYNTSGELVGIVNCKMETTGVEGMCYAIPTDIVKPLVEKIVQNYEQTGTTTANRCLLSIIISTKESESYFDETTQTYKTKSKVTVSSINDGSVASGILEVNDILLSATLGDKTINIDYSYSLPILLLSANQNDIIKIKLLRNSEIKEVEITLSYLENL